MNQQAAKAGDKIKPTPGTAVNEPGAEKPADTSPDGDLRPVNADEERLGSSRWLPLLPPVLGGLIVVVAVLNTLRAALRRRSR